MKLINLFVLLTFVAMVTSCKKASVAPSTENPDSSNPIVNGDSIFFAPTRGYLEPYSEGITGIEIKDDESETGKIEDWSNASIMQSWYLYFTPGTYDFFIKGTIETGKNAKFRIYISDVNSNSIDSSDITFEGTGVSKFYTAKLGVNINNDNAYKILLKPLSKTGNLFFQQIEFLTIVAADANSTVRDAKYLSSPSTHLRYSTENSDNKNLDYLYCEIEIPANSDPLYTFWMAVGHQQGYFGMQTNGNTERRFLFSLWSEYDTENPNEIPEDYRVKVLDKGDGVLWNEFGNEGSGAQAIFRNYWQTGNTYKFLLNVRPNKNENYSLFTAWIKDESNGGDWKYIATYLKPKKSEYLKGFHSFLENFGPTTGYRVRKGIFKNSWVHVKDGDWKPVISASLTNTDGEVTSDNPSPRDDYSAGVESGNQFFMQSGGYLNPSFGNRTYSISPLSTPPIQSLTAFEQRVTQAFNNYEVGETYDFVDRTGWKVINLSSEETEGEGDDNGRGADILDNNNSTFWHSSWTADPVPTPPHYFTVDMLTVQSIKGILLRNRTNFTGRMKDVNVKISNDNSNFTDVGNFSLSQSLEETIKFSATLHARYIKLTIKSVWDSDGTQSNTLYTHLAEFKPFK